MMKFILTNFSKTTTEQNIIVYKISWKRARDLFENIDIADFMSPKKSI